MSVNRRLLYFVAALIWGAPGVAITIKGVRAYCALSILEEWWLLLISVGVLLFFFFIFRSVVGKYIAHISALPDKAPLWHTFPMRGWAIIIFMMGLGISLKYIPNIPLQFIASFYSALGPMLLWSAARFLVRYLRYL